MVFRHKDKYEVYFAARFDEKEKLSVLAKRLKTASNNKFIVNSQWLKEPDLEDTKGNPLGNNDLLTDYPVEYLQKKAFTSFTDVMMADLFVLFSDTPKDNPTRGGCNVELGVALAMAKPIVVMGGAKENIFHEMPYVQYEPDWKLFFDINEKMAPENTPPISLLTKHLDKLTELPNTYDGRTTNRWIMGQCLQLMIPKSLSYASDDDAYANFRTKRKSVRDLDNVWHRVTEKFNRTDGKMDKIPEKGFWTQEELTKMRMIEDPLYNDPMDQACLSVIFMGMIEEKRREYYKNGIHSV